MGEFIFTHSSWVEGAREFGEKLADVEGVKRARAAPTTGRRSRRFRILVRIAKAADEIQRSVQVIYGTTDGHQTFYVSPLEGVTLETLRHSIRTWALHYTDTDGKQRNGGERLVRDDLAALRTIESRRLRIMSQPVDGDIAPGQASSVIHVSHIFKLTLAEARGLRDLCPNGMIPERLPMGSTKRLGSGLWESFKRDKYTSSEGTGPKTIVRPDAQLFRETLFEVKKTEGYFKERMSEPTEPLPDRTSLTAWWEELVMSIENFERTLPTSPEPGATSPTAGVDFSDTIALLNTQIAALTPDIDKARTELERLKEQQSSLVRQRDALEKLQNKS